MHKYLNELGIKSTDPCIFNTKDDDNKSERLQRLETERMMHSFDSRETWALNFTSATWLYEHLKCYLDNADLVVNLNFYSFDIPVLECIPYEDMAYQGEHAVCYCKEHTEHMTQKEAIKTIIKYLEKYLVTEEYNEQELEKALEYLSCAFKIYSIIIGAMWW